MCACFCVCVRKKGRERKEVGENKFNKKKWEFQTKKYNKLRTQKKKKPQIKI